MNRDTIDYNQITNEALYTIVYRTLKKVETHGMQGNHYFIVSFETKHPGVKISEHLAKLYPNEMAIVLQYQFKNLQVDLNGFSVQLTSNGKEEKMQIPFSALVSFSDPSVQFGLQFNQEVNGFENEPAPEKRKTILKNDQPEGNVVSFEKYKRSHTNKLARTRI